jgi:uncharacterized protein YaiI (UPF0178 family)
MARLTEFHHQQHINETKKPKDIMQKTRKEGKDMKGNLD